ncbi:MAG: hypothetical protein JWM93_152 [Frankiales bacterium]|nr:hypothetical protein [Frankiales bacterium]
MLLVAALAVGDDVVAGSAVDHVVARAAIDLVVARAVLQDVVAVAAEQGVEAHRPVDRHAVVAGAAVDVDIDVVSDAGARSLTVGVVLVDRRAQRSGLTLG